MCCSNQKRERGNTLYAREEYSRAVDIYKMYVNHFGLLLGGLGWSCRFPVFLVIIND